MAEELQSLLERIQKDGVAQAEAEAEKTLGAAREKAATIVAEAEENAKAIQEKAERDATAFSERGKKSLEQAARDVILSVEGALMTTLKALVDKEISGAATGDTLKQMLVKVVESYSHEGKGDSRLDVLLNPKDQEQLADFFMSNYGTSLRDGVEVKGDGNVISGFRVSVVGEEVEHDFSGEAISEAMCRLLRPRLAEIVRSAAGSGPPGQKTQAC